MKVSTERFKELVTRAHNGVGNNKLRPITQFILIKVEGTELSIVTTDGTNYLYVFDEIDNQDDFYVVVEAEQFSKLIGKMTTEYVELTVENNVLSVIGNGSYLIELPLDEDGETVKYPDPYDKFMSEKHKKLIEGELLLSDIQIILDSVKASLLTKDDDPVYRNYFVGNNVVATDHCKIAGFNKKLFDKDFLISSELMNLLGVIDASPISYQIADDTMVFEADDCVVVGKASNGLDSFSIDDINELLNTEFPSVVKIDKQMLLNLLDRMSLFVGKHDDNALKLIFTENHIIVTNQNQKSSEIIDYKDSKDFEAFECIIDVPTFVTQLKAYSSDVVELHYGREESIKLVDGDIIQIIALNE